MIIESLFPEMCNLFGDVGNMRYLRLCLPDADWIETAYDEKPAFVDRDVNLLYIGPATENAQVKMIEALLPYRARLQEMIENGTVILATGNAHEIFGHWIDDVKTGRVECLDLLDFTVRRDMMHRTNGPVLGTFEGMDVLGFRATFTQTFPGKDLPAFLQVKKGAGMNPECHTEGIRVNNFFGTYLLGPLLVLNPSFTKDLICRMGGPKEPVLAFESEVEDAYRERLKDFEAKVKA